MRLQDKTAIITGAAMGIGRACAKRFAEEGARVLVSDVRAEEGQSVVDAIREEGGEACFLEADVRRREDNEALIERCIDEYGRLDILFCNAGVTLAKQLTESTDEEIDRLFDINVKGLMYASRAALPHMLDQGGGSILFTASKTGLVAQEDSPVYCASKGAAVMLAKALALDYATDDIRVNALCPGIIDTPMLERFADAMPNPEAVWREFEEAQPIGRLGTPKECADAALWLVSDESSFITGVALPVDGGFTAM
jgi:NAD(P)-dependent dehydrogenase (short-subunit alcohol dehydrogenase family)